MGNEQSGGQNQNKTTAAQRKLLEELATDNMRRSNANARNKQDQLRSRS